jgi:hypothetical protein
LIRRPFDVAVSQRAEERAGAVLPDCGLQQIDEVRELRLERVSRGCHELSSRAPANTGSRDYMTCHPQFKRRTHPANAKTMTITPQISWVSTDPVFLLSLAALH